MHIDKGTEDGVGSHQNQIYLVEDSVDLLLSQQRLFEQKQNPLVQPQIRKKRGWGTGLMAPPLGFWFIVEILEHFPAVLDLSWRCRLSLVSEAVEKNQAI